MSLWPLIALIALAASTAGAIWLAGRRAGTAAEAARTARDETQIMKDAIDAEGRMLKAARDRPVDHDDLARRMRDGSF